MLFPYKSHHVMSATSVGTQDSGDLAMWQAPQVGTGSSNCGSGILLNVYLAAGLMVVSKNKVFV